MPRRGEVWRVRLDPTEGSEIRKTRPCVVRTSDILNERQRTVVVIPLSSSPHASPPVLVPVRSSGRAAVAVIDQIRAVAKERLEAQMDTLTATDLAAVEDAPRQVLERG